MIVSLKIKAILAYNQFVVCWYMISCLRVTTAMVEIPPPNGEFSNTIWLYFRYVDSTFRCPTHGNNISRYVCRLTDLRGPELFTRHYCIYWPGNTALWPRLLGDSNRRTWGEARRRMSKYGQATRRISQQRYVFSGFPSAR